MRVISKRPFIEAARCYPNAALSLDDIWKVLNSRDYITPEQLKAQFASLDRFKYRRKWWVINAAGNHLRIITYIKFETQNVFIKHIVTHDEYDRLTDYYRRHPE
ncbi:type II toxin-antitoxin system HigB family toxin [Erwinia sp. MYb375]|uniref:type II toxin-antitoxin system HigB family toxin n=1 Tax=unclassified Erwinia TaxID=2622719 RepID=UPI0030A6B585